MTQRFKNELELETHLKSLITQHLTNYSDDFILLDNKNIADIVLCRNTDPIGLYFLEVKHLKKSMGRLGFGGKGGSGYQPEIVSKRPLYLETNLKWVLYSETHDNDGLVLISTKQLCENYLQGNNVGEKYNGIKKDIFNKETGLNDAEFIDNIKSWLGI